MSNLPLGKEYIGIAYNKETPIESDNPSDYTWSKFKGDQGIPGQQGEQGTPGVNGSDGKTYYTWIKYALDERGTGITDNPAGMAYIGVSYNNLSPVESNNPSDYAWSKIKGEDGEDGRDGIPGKDGQDGKTYYTWIRYADDINGNGISNSSVGKTYIGIAYNRDTQTESNNPKDYAWSLIKGEQGVPGINGEDGKTYFTWIKYSKYPDGREMQDDPADMKYMGIAYNKDTQTESTNPRDYAWSLIKGQDGTTFYTWIRYADDEFGNGMSDSSANKEYIGIAYNMPTQQESTNPSDYTWTRIKGDQGLPGAPGSDGVSLYTWVKYADDNMGTGMSDSPEGKAWLGLAFNKEVQQESNDYREYNWSKIKGETGADGKPGADGDIGDFPDTLPAVPTITVNSMFATIALAWTYESKVYYEYELYASQTKDFTPNVSNLLFKGQASAFLHEVKPSQTWYYRVRAVNSHGRATAFSAQASGSTFKLTNDNIENYIEELAIGQALIKDLNADKIVAGKVKGIYVDAKELTVTDGSGKRTLYVDSYGRVYLDVSQLQINSSNVETEQGALNKIEEAKNETDRKIEQEVNGLNGAINNLDNYVNGAFRDGILTEAEKEVIREHLKIVQREKEDVTAQVEALKVSVELRNTTELTNLNNKQTAFNTAYTNLYNAMKNIIDTGAGSYDTQMTAYKAKVAELRTAMQTANEKVSQVKANTVENNINSQIENMQNSVNKELGELSDAIANVKDDVISSIEDGILDDVEKAKIEASLRALASEKADVDQEYKTVYANPDLIDITGATCKTNLKTKYDTYVTRYNELVNYINVALGASTVTTNMKNNINTGFTNHDVALGAFKAELQVAINFIATRKTNIAISSAKTYTDAQIKVQSDRITATVSSVTELKGQVSSQQSSIELLSNKITSKVDASGVKSIIEQSPNSVKIGFNGITDSIVMSSEGMDFKTTGGLLHTRIRNGTLNFLKLDGSSSLGSFRRSRWANNEHIEGLSCSMDEQTTFGVSFRNGNVYTAKFIVSNTNFGDITEGTNIYTRLNLHGAPIIDGGTINCSSVSCVSVMTSSSIKAVGAIASDSFIQADGNLRSVNGNIYANNGSIYAPKGEISGKIIIGTNATITALSAGTIDATSRIITNSYVSAGTSVSASTFIQADGNLRSVNGHIYANTGNIYASSGNIFASSGQVKSNTVYANSWVSGTQFITHTAVALVDEKTRSISNVEVETEATMSMTPNIEHIGSAEVIDGECVVQLPLPLTRFGTNYVIQITPIGLGNIYVAEKNSDSFVVKGDDLEFDYVIKLRKAKLPARLRNKVVAEIPDMQDTEIIQEQVEAKLPNPISELDIPLTEEFYEELADEPAKEPEIVPDVLIFREEDMY